MMNLFTEMEAAFARMTERHEDFLAQHGARAWARHTSVAGYRMVNGVVETYPVEPYSYDSRRLCGCHPIVDHDDGTFDFAEEGRNAIIVPAGTTSPIDGGWEDIFDLVAFRLDQPDLWWLRAGETLLGESHLRDRFEDRRPARLVETPLDWLRAGGEAACVLDWARFDPRSAFAGLAAVECATHALGRRLKRRIADLSRPRFDVTVPIAPPPSRPTPPVLRRPSERGHAHAT